MCQKLERAVLQRIKTLISGFPAMLSSCGPRKASKVEPEAQMK